MLLGAVHRPPDILVTGDARLVGVRTADGGMMLSSSRVERFAGESWVRRAGAGQAGQWPAGTVSDDGRLRCDALACVYRQGNARIAIVSREEALVGNCGDVDMIVAMVPVRRRCPAVRQVIDRFDMWRNGAHAIWVDGTGILRVESTRLERGDRPWVPKPEARPRPSRPGG
jgi:competence protein ComEC